MTPSSRALGIRPSPIRVISDGAPPEAIPLGLGEPSWPMPDAARRALAAFDRVCAYGPTAVSP